MRAPADQNVDIHLSRCRREDIHIAYWYTLSAGNDSKFQGSMVDDGALREMTGLYVREIGYERMLSFTTEYRRLTVSKSPFTLNTSGATVRR